MRWKQLRRRFTLAAPRVQVRSHLPWPVRWLLAALMLGICAALAMWAFEFGREIAGFDKGAKQELAKLREEVERLRSERSRFESVANSAESLIRTEKTAQEQLAAQVKSMEAQNLALLRDLGFFERLLPSGGGNKAVSARGFVAEPVTAGQLSYQLLLLVPGLRSREFKGSYELTLSGTLSGKAWTYTVPRQSSHNLSFKQYQRLEGVIDYPGAAVVKQLQVRVLDVSGVAQATESVRL
ncbi:MAG: DUF6776 family protein [Leptothrix sp. (in: b-proteobacteria)]